jgi:hypothetical protein
MLLEWSSPFRWPPLVRLMFKNTFDEREKNVCLLVYTLYGLIEEGIQFIEKGGTTDEH